MRRPIGALVVVGGVAVGCVVDEPPPGAVGLDGVVAFEAPTDLVFTERAGVGSTFEVTARPLDGEEVAFSDVVDVGVNAADVATVAVIERKTDAVTFSVTVVGGGTARVAITDGEAVVDRIDIKGVPLADTLLVDAQLLGVSDRVDITAPASFSLLRDVLTTFGISAVDRCAAGALDLGATTLSAEGLDGGDVSEEVTVTSTGLGGFEITSGLADLEFDLVMQTPGLEPLRYRARTVVPANVEEVRLEVAAVDTEASTATAWARALVDGEDVLGVGDYRWTSSDRVTLTAGSGPAVVAGIGASTSASEETPATVTLSAFGEEATIDLFTLAATDLVAGRAAPPSRPGDDDEEEDEAEDTSGAVSGCGSEAPVCDPLAAAIPLIGLRRLRRLARR